MGAHVSQEIDNAVNLSLSITHNQTQDCIAASSENQTLQFCAARGCNLQNSRVQIGTVNWEQDVVYTTACQQNINITDDIQTEISNTFAQQAEAIAQQFQLARADVDEVVRTATGIGATITTNSFQNCVTTAVQNQSINFGCTPDPSGYCDIVIDQLNFRQGTNAITNCVANTTSTANIVNSVKQQISQKGTAKVESIFGPLFALALVVLIIIGAVYFGGAKLLLSWKLWLSLLLLILLYLAIAFVFRWFPF